MLKITILDGYVDEPTCLGVPPYVSPYPRYIAGAIWNFDKKSKITYLTIDQIRNDWSLIQKLSKSNLVITIAGMAVPGRYLSGFPASPNEIKKILTDVKKPMKILCGPAAKYGFGLSGGKKTRELNSDEIFDLIVKGDGEKVVKNLLENKFDIDNIDKNEVRKNSKEIREYAIFGSNIVKQHPFYPNYIIAEIETYRGCSRSIVGGCSFCCEPRKGLPDFRPMQDVFDEIKKLYENGIRHFRIGNQPCIFTYMSKEIGNKELPKPNPTALDKLFKGIRKVAPDLQTLHIDNANPGVIAHYPEESKKIAKSIIKYHTSGDVAALGIESADPEVVKQNNLKATTDEVLFAISLFNEIGSSRGNTGLPELLPGLNFVFGLMGETKKTFRLNYDFLRLIYDKNLLVRRINLRQVIPIPGTKLFEFGNKNVIKNKNEFQRFKRKFKIEIERPMLQKIIPSKTILKNVFTEMYRGKTTFGRQIGTYPILVGIPGICPINTYIDVKVIDHGYRSITALPFPLEINTTSIEILESIPGIGKKRVMRLIKNRPFKNNEEIIKSLDDQEIGKQLLDYIKI
jgi:radical SAM superfamily enzyme with C-terminal helix-hairpin-helix motif